MKTNPTNPTTKKFFQLVDIYDYRFSVDREKCSHIDFYQIATDCDTKTISLLEAINHLGISIMSETEEKKIDKNKIMTLSGVIADLAELAIATNKIAVSATYSSGYKDAENV
ncbi:TPA: hypothetical protein U2Q62_003495 [Citrobacter amalonaticus]|uniref:hypothetical protein n=1 Tax=Citrobacter amalonaticus TaxID=35703 RepID=UPI00287B4F6E|nr:hypothetical protein [Citrobacter amalonaticus]MDS4039354.1 hypothetical protein [Citrobacter amalonaticus]HED3078250.1 hypothetical protein [Citrobacter amalonaticus]HED3671748.1 hypothetical protein [Citrobacter amalonaticus]HED3697846.1 hypothetical protein [Citrobacter amalonaticus]HEM8623908.1 hypothetical protein [Citrobacter amalonaticus]